MTAVSMVVIAGIIAVNDSNVTKALPVILTVFLLAGILITVGIGVMDYKGLKAIPSLPKDIKIGPLK